MTTDELTSEWHAFVWAHLGERVRVTFEIAGVEVTREGCLIAHDDGSYQVGGTFVTPRKNHGPWAEGIPVRWTLVTTA